MIAVLLLALAEVATPVVPAPAGDWIVDLTSKPGDSPYRQPMRLELKFDGTVTGKFYRSDIQAGRWKTDRKRTCVGFRTTDGAVPYHTAACQTGGTVTGQTWAEHRNFLLNWNAVRGVLR